MSAIAIGATSARAQAVRPGASQRSANRQASGNRPPLAVSLWLLVAVIGGLAGAIGLIYTSWRNSDLVRRRTATN